MLDYFFSIFGLFPISLEVTTLFVQHCYVCLKTIHYFVLELLFCGQ